MSMLRRGGKRICMDEPPPDYDPQTPMTPMVESDGYAYTPYAAQPQTPMTSTGVEGYGEAFVAYESNASSVTSPSHLEVGAPGHFSTPYVEHALPSGGNPYAQPQHQEFEVPAQPVHRGRGRPKGSKNKTAAASAATRSASPGSATTTTSPRRGAAVAAKQAISAAASAASDDTTERSQTTQNTPRKRGRPRKYPIETITEDESSLYNIVRNGRAALQQLVDDWIESYKVNRDSALLTLMQFFISASGCKGKITPEMQATMEHAAIIRKMTEEFDEESGEYPLIMAGQQWKKFKSSFCEFVQVLVKQCQYSIIYDQYLMDNLISLLTGLSDSQVRAFRHTATLAAMKLMTALVDVALTVSVYLDNTQRQYETERQKARDKRATDRLESLKTKHQELEENMDEIKNMLTFTFKSVFVHRYRDTLPEIRAICMAEIGIWMKKFSQSFLDDSYLKYIGWTLHDKVGDVRLKCLQALQPLYADENLKGKLELFTSKFKDRIVSMTLDKEFDVAVQAVRLVISILKYHRDILTDKDCESIYELVFSSHRAVAQAAGEFLNERLLFLPEEGTPEPTRTRRGKKRLPNTPHIRDLLQFFIESELHEHAAYLVDSLIDSNDMLKDWECMTDLLLEEPGPEEEPMDDRQESSLIEIMVCAVKQAATGDPPVGRGPNKKTTSAKEAKQVQEDKVRLTEHFIQALPPLLAKYKPDAEKVANLLTIPQYFELEIYTTSRQPKALDDLLANLKNIVEMHSAAEVLEVTAKTLEVLCEDHAMLSHCDILRSALLDGIVTRFKDALDDYMGIMEEEDPNEDEVFALKSNIRRVAVFYSCHDMGPWDIWDTMFKLIADWSKSLPEEVVKHCMTTCYYGILWELRHLEHASDRTTTAAEQQKKLRDKLDTYIPLMTEIVKTSDVALFREEAFLSICDLLVVFSRQLDHNPLLRSLIYECDPTLQQTMNHFIQTYVFVDDDEEEQDEHTKIEELHKRRNFLACYCKLVVYNIISVRCAADIFKHYVKHYNNYGDIIKTTLGKAREINKTNCARTMVLSLIMLFKALQREQPRMDRQSQDFIDIKEVAKRFALSFGLDALKNREAVAALHREGILFSINPLENPNDPTGAPPHLPFLEILAEFTNKLLKQDKRVVMAFLDKRITMGMPSSRNEDWQPLLLYRNSLLHGEGDAPSQPSKRAYTRRKKEEDGAGADEGGDEGDEAGSDQEF